MMFKKIKVESKKNSKKNPRENSKEFKEVIEVKEKLNLAPD